MSARTISRGSFVVVSFLFVLSYSALNAQDYTFEPFVGPVGGAGWYDGSGSAARFRTPDQVAVDSSGNIYVADEYNHVIRKVTPLGIVATLAGGARTPGAADGTSSEARFNRPAGVAADSSGNVYVADTFNHAIRKISPQGVVVTLAGLLGVSGTADGSGTGARFKVPTALTLDGSGNIYVADRFNSTIRKVTPAGVVTTIAGLAGVTGGADGTGTSARFNFPQGVTFDASSGNLYVADANNHTIRRVTPAGVVTTLAGLAGSIGSTDGTGSAARFRNPAGVTTDGAGNVFVTDNVNRTIRRITPDGVVTTFAGLAGSSGNIDGTGSAARFGSSSGGPTGIACDSVGNLYVGDTGNGTIRKVTASAVVITLAGMPGGLSGSTDGTGSAARFFSPDGLAIDASGNIFVAEQNNHIIRKVTPAGEVTTLAGSPGSFGSADGTGSAARFRNPAAIAIDGSGTLYVCDAGNHTIRRVTPGGVVTTFAGLALTPGSTDGNGTAARFNVPVGITIDSSGNLFVADSFNSTIRKITPAADVTTFAGQTGVFGFADGTGTAAIFDHARSLTVDSGNNLYVKDRICGIRVRKISPAAVVTTPAFGMDSIGGGSCTGAVALEPEGTLLVTDGPSDSLFRLTPPTLSMIAGFTDSEGATDGTGTIAEFGNPAGIALDSSGTLYVSDLHGNAIRRGRRTNLVAAATATPASACIGASVQLGTTANDATSWSWRLVRRQADSQAELSATSTQNPTFVPDRLGFYRFLLRAEGPAGVRYSIADLNVACNGPALSMSDLSLAEGASGTSNGAFVITLAEASTFPVSFDYFTIDGSAVAPSDYTPTSGRGVLAPGQTSMTINVPVAGDTLQEAAETFRLVIASPENAVISDVDGVATILNDDIYTALTLTLSGDGILEPGDALTVMPRWRNDGSVAVPLNGAASAFGGPGGATYTLTDAAASYGTVAAGESATCSDCYAMSLSVPATRPATHWDATFVESLDSLASRTWRMHVGESFSDVPKTSPFYLFIERALHGSVTAGCGGGSFCPGAGARREEMAAFISRGIAGGDANVPPTGTIAGVGDYACIEDGISRFIDVQPTGFFCRHIHYMRANSLTTGCNQEGTLFCPATTTTRLEMAIFVARSLVNPHGDASVPPAVLVDGGTGLNEFGLPRSYDCAAGTTFFSDVPSSSPFCKHAHYLWARGVIDGFLDGTFHPGEAVSREQMAKFISNAFKLTLNHAE